MSIAYVWFNKYGKLQDVEINFSKEYIFKYNNGKLTKNKRINNNNILEILGYKNIDNPIAIVGENGSGKSTIIRFLIDLQFYEGTFPDYYKYIIIFYKSDQYTVYSNFHVDFSIEDNFCYISYNDALFNQKISREFYKNKIINYTEAFNPYRYNELMLYNKVTDFDYSVEGRIARYKTKYQNSELKVDPIQLYQYKSVENQVKIISEFSKITGFTNTISVEIIKNGKIKSNVLEIIDSLHALITDKYEKGKNNILYALVNNLVNKMLLSINLTERKKEKVEEIVFIVERMVKRMEQYQQDITLEEIVSFLEIIEELPENHVLNISRDEKESYVTVLTYLYNMSAKMTYRKDIDRFFYNPGTDDGWGEFVEFYEAYAKTTCNGECAYLNFSWGMSTGEMSLLNMFATVKEIVENKEVGDSTDIILLFDEAGLYWHPRWQQEGMKRILEILGKVDNQVQLVLATHSPIFLSDFPKSNVYWLSTNDEDRANEHLETFGANIYNLYRDSFFLNQKFGSIVGTLSSDVIENISYSLLELNDFYNEHKDREDCAIVREKLNVIKKDIEQIGEYIFRKDLLCKWERVYNKIFGENEFVEEKIISLFTKLDKNGKKRILECIRSDDDG